MRSNHGTATVLVPGASIESGRATERCVAVPVEVSGNDTGDHDDRREPRRSPPSAGASGRAHDVFGENTVRTVPVARPAARRHRDVLPPNATVRER
jgi:hypothetical protein